ncbi:MAG: metallophosphoesterase [Ruminococcus sp.]|uniref:metallophosphoesterase n=1 Tax=Ruminococcus sp. TaxID=41978 RepID=UPI0025F61F00|nr:metallophosphoesterase [Ruminococcus sp.]MCR5600899.1 metallophosphoesterase [Ruminococcus sp.]
MAENNQKAPEGAKPKKPKKEHNLSFLLWLLLIVVLWWFNNFALKETHVEIKTAKVKSTLKFAIISDLHATRYGISNKTISNAIREAHPDIVFMLGDMYTSDSKWEIMSKPIELAADIISAGYPVYAVTGEHDTDQRYISELEKAGVNVMNYKDQVINVRGNDLHIMGIDNVFYSDTFDLNSEFQLVDGCYNILLAHIPNYDKFSAFGADLTLCGDTHGEMARLPFFGPIYHSETSTWLPKLLDSELEIYDKGLFDYDRGKMFVTSGIGSYPYPVRFCNRPEVVIMEVKPKG